MSYFLMSIISNFLFEYVVFLSKYVILAVYFLSMLCRQGRMGAGLQGCGGARVRGAGMQGEHRGAVYKKYRYV